MTELYDRIGHDYPDRRRPDPRIARLIREGCGRCASLVNVGAGTGSYEPTDLPVVAVELSRRMIAQRARRETVVQARVEALPLRDAAADVVMGVLTLHHWADRGRGLAECARVARRRVVLLTWDPESDGFWLVQDYFPEVLALDRAIFPAMAEIRAALGAATVTPVPIPADCVDGFTGAYWRRPAAYLDAGVRAGMSSFTRIENLEAGLAALRRDLATGAWNRRYGHLLAENAADLGYRLVTAELS